MAIDFQQDKDGIVTLTLNAPEQAVNTLNQAHLQAMEQVLEKLEQGIAREADRITGVIITSAKKTFFAGGNLDEIIALKKAQAPAFFKVIEAIKAQLRRLEQLNVPVVAAINGSALGGGLEIALACHWRIVLDRPNLKIGFPEVSLGLLPGSGGIVRLVRMLGLEKAFPLLSEGRKLKPSAALQVGFVDQIAPDPSALFDLARQWILANPSAKQAWDKPHFKIPGGDPRHPKVTQMVTVAPAMIRKKTRGNFPAPEAILNAAVEGALLSFDAASKVESRYFIQLATGQTAKNIIGSLWFQLNEIHRGSSRPKDNPQRKFSNIGILGAGMMGAGIAYDCARNGLNVTLKDRDIESANKGKAYSESLLAKQVQQGRISARDKDTILKHIHPSTAAADLQACDLIIEAVFEDRQLKAQVTEEAEAQVASSAIFASNTSTLPISSLAQASSRPENFIGLHFFSPVDKMPLVEIIKGQQTSAQTLAGAFDFVRQIGKTPIVVNDSRGFYTSRVFKTYVLEGIAMLAEGQHPVMIDRLGLLAGMPIGPLALVDEVSLSLVVDIMQQTKIDLEAEGIQLAPHPAETVILKMVQQFKRYGKKAGAGFYSYPEKADKHIWPDLQQHFPTGTKLPKQDIIDRLLFVQCLEAIRCLEEKVVNSVADTNIGSLFGWGFPANKGGVLQFINDYGLNNFVTRSKELTLKYGARFQPTDELMTKASSNSVYSSNG